jgi:hypothetical protein
MSTVLRLHRMTIAEMAHEAARAVIANPPEPDVVIPYEDVFAWGGFPPKPSSTHEFEKWQLAALDFKERFCAHVGKELGRYPLVEPGHGYRIPAPGEVAPAATEQMLARVEQGARKAGRMVRTVRPDDLDPGERNVLENSKSIISLVKKTARKARKQQEADEQFEAARKAARRK